MLAMKKISIFMSVLFLISCNKNDINQTVVETGSSYIATDKISSLYKTTFIGKATFYEGSIMGNCSEEYPSNQLYAAMNQTQYDNSNACGACAEVSRQGTTKKVVVKILDRCPECPNGNIDLSKTAFLKIGTVAEGIIPISWKYIECPNLPKISIRIKEGSSRYWIALQIRNHKYMVKKLEIKNNNGVYETLPKEIYNYFIDNNGIFNGNGPDGPYSLRITDVSGNIITTNIPLRVGSITQTNVQFPFTPLN
jgi:expansin